MNIDFNEMLCARLGSAADRLRFEQELVDAVREALARLGAQIEYLVGVELDLVAEANELAETKATKPQRRRLEELRRQEDSVAREFYNAAYDYRDLTAIIWAAMAPSGNDNEYLGETSIEETIAARRRRTQEQEPPIVDGFTLLCAQRLRSAARGEPRQGRRPTKRWAIEEKMRAEIVAGDRTLAALLAMSRKDLGPTYGVHPRTAVAARDRVLREFRDLPS